MRRIDRDRRLPKQLSEQPRYDSNNSSESRGLLNDLSNENHSRSSAAVRTIDAVLSDRVRNELEKIIFIILNFI